MTSVSSADMRCYQNRVGTATATIAAGERLGFVANAMVSHFGPLQFYMAKVPDSANINTWEATGNVWFKVSSIGAVQGNGPLTSDENTWPAYSMSIHVSRCATTRATDDCAQKNRSLTFRFRRMCPAASILFAWKVLHCTRRSLSAAPRSISVAHR